MPNKLRVTIIKRFILPGLKRKFWELLLRVTEKAKNKKNIKSKYTNENLRVCINIELSNGIYICGASLPQEYRRRFKIENISIPNKLLNPFDIEMDYEFKEWHFLMHLDCFFHFIIYIFVELLWHTPATNVVLYVNYTPIKKNLKLSYLKLWLPHP